MQSVLDGRNFFFVYNTSSEALTFLAQNTRFCNENYVTYKKNL